MIEYKGPQINHHSSLRHTHSKRVTNYIRDHKEVLEGQRVSSPSLSTMCLTNAPILKGDRTCVSRFSVMCGNETNLTARDCILYKNDPGWGLKVLRLFFAQPLALIPAMHLRSKSQHARKHKPRSEGAPQGSFGRVIDIEGDLLHRAISGTFSCSPLHRFVLLGSASRSLKRSSLGPTSAPLFLNHGAK